MVTVIRDWAISIILLMISTLLVIVVLFVAVAIIGAVLLDDPSGAEGEDSAIPIATQAVSPISELEIVEDEGEDIAVPLLEETPQP